MELGRDSVFLTQPNSRFFHVRAFAGIREVPQPMGSHAPSRVDVFQPSSSLSIRPHPEPLPHQLSFLELISALHKGQYNLLYLLRTCSISLQLYSPEIALCPTLP